MKLEQIYKFFVEEGIKADPRGKKEVEKYLKELKKAYSELKPKEKEYFDKESLWNPYSDSRILNGSGKENVKTILVGIDMEGPELLLADRLKEKGKKVDLVLAHHPEGKALAGLYSVMKMQGEILHKYGIPINVAEGLMQGRISEVETALSAVNHRRAIDIAKILGISLMCAHTVADNHVQTWLQEKLEKKKPETVKELLEELLKIPEYSFAAKHSAGPKIFLGSPENKCGKIFVEMTGGTEGAKELYEKMVDAGIGTVVGMHLAKDHLEEAKKHKFNYIVAGHICSDNIGVNLLLDKLERKGKFNIIEASGFTRFKRK
jgi:hypothetical protein